MVIEWIPLECLSVDGVQTRARLRLEAIKDYAHAIRTGERLPPGVAFRDGDTLWLAAGHHRREAYRLASRDRMPVQIREGSRFDAIKHGIADNLRHVGERLTREDKRHAAKLILTEQPSLSDSAVAKLVGISPTTVGRYRAELTFQIGKSAIRIGRDGRSINTANVGRKPSPSTEPATASCPEGVMGPDVGAGAPSVSQDDSRCKCGNEWTADGEGGRFCERCMAEPPAQEEPVLGGQSKVGSEGSNNGAGHTENASEVTEEPRLKRLQRCFHEFIKALGTAKRVLDDLGDLAPGADYHQVMDKLNEADRLLTKWRKAVERSPGPVPDQVPF